MEKIFFALIAIVMGIGIATTIFAKSDKPANELDPQVKEWEVMAEHGDTAAMHRLIEFYDEDSIEYVEVEAVVEPDGTEWTAEQIDSLNAETKMMPSTQSRQPRNRFPRFSR